MAIATIANLTIQKLKDDFIPFVELELEQFITDHARVKIKIDLEHIGENVLSKPMERIALINETFQINVQTISENKSITDVYDFLGIITDIHVELDAGQHGWMYIFGAGQSIELERGRFLRTHSDKKLSDIVNRVIENKVYVLVTNDPEYTKKINFSMQFYETDYQYIKRLAWMYGEKLLFNGNNLIFGKITKEYTTKLTYNEDLVEVKLNSRLISNRFKQYYHTLEEIQSDAISEISDNTTFTGAAGIQSDKLNQKEHYPNVPITTPVYDFESIRMLTDARKQSTMNRMFYITGKTNMYKVTIGELLEIDFGDKMIVDESVGTLRVTRVLHIFDQNQRYYNEFEACQKAYDYFPYEDIEMPVAQPITATVKNNQDPEKLGRVQLKFDFEKEQCQHWFRCVTPDGGGYKPIGKRKNRGMIFVPEQEDRVVLGFMEGNPDKPYVAGSFFHGTNAENHSNNIRSISDKANNYIQWNSGAGITIMDKGGNKIELSGNGYIDIVAKEEIVLRAGAGSLGSGIRLRKDGRIDIKGKNIIVQALDDPGHQQIKIVNADPELAQDSVDEPDVIQPKTSAFNLITDNIIGVDAENEITVSSKDKIIVSATNNADLMSTVVNTVGTTEVNIGGKKVNINSN